jgi:hypothetical protein
MGTDRAPMRLQLLDEAPAAGRLGVTTIGSEPSFGFLGRTRKVAEGGRPANMLEFHRSIEKWRQSGSTAGFGARMGPLRSYWRCL